MHCYESCTPGLSYGSDHCHPGGDLIGSCAGFDSGGRNSNNGASLHVKVDMVTRESTSGIAINHVKAGREEEFEAFLRDVIGVAAQRVRPHLVDKFQALRPVKSGVDGPSPYFFLFYGDDPEEDWDLDRMFREAYGDDEGHRRSQQWLDLLEGEQENYDFSDEVRVV